MIGEGAGSHTGSVSDFDEERGTGLIVDEDGSSHPFHCTAISDGSRHVEVGARVSFEVIAGHLGRWEATAIRPADSR